jgi:copper chaperone CopZ
MKTKVLSLAALFMMGAVSVFAGVKTEKMKINGNYGMCESRIEKAVNSIDGVSKADWNKDSKILEVTFDDKKTTSAMIEVAVAAVGHDTPHQHATKEVYNKLPDCCKYDRTAEIADPHAGYKH